MQDNTRESLEVYQRLRRLAVMALFVAITFGLLFVASSQSAIAQVRIELSGMMLILIGIAGRSWSILYIGGHKAWSVVDTGPYSIMRNPLYFFSTIAAGGMGAQSGSLWIALLFALACWLAFMVVTLREERVLTDNLGQPYRDYIKRVPRFFPNPFLYRDRPEVTFRPDLLKRTFLDGLLFFLFVPIFALIEQAQNAAWLPVLLYLA